MRAVLGACFETADQALSEESPGPGWWQASDGKWYSPVQVSAVAPPPVPNRRMTELRGTGIDFQVVVDSHFVMFTRKRVRDQWQRQDFTGHETRVSIDEITAVRYKKSGLASGYIQFAVPGTKKVDIDPRFYTDPQADSNSVRFARGHEASFKAIRDYAEHRIAMRQTSGPMTSPHPQSVADQIRELAQLRDDGLLSNDEFNAQKAKLLA